MKSLTLFFALPVFLFSTAVVHASSNCGMTVTGFPSPDFSSSLSSNLIKAAPQENVVIATSAIHSVLTMAFLGMGEATASRIELGVALRYPPALSSEFIASENGRSLRALRSEGNGQESPIFRQVNTVFVRPGFQLSPEYEREMKKEFDSAVVPATPADLDTVNSVVKNLTNGKIDKVLEHISDDMSVVLVSAEYVKGGWASPFKKSETKTESFYPDGASSARAYDVDMMAQDGHYRIAETDKAQVVEMPLAGEMLDGGQLPRYAAIVTIPKGKYGVEDVSEFSPEQLLAGAKPKFIHLVIPKFNLKSSSDLIPTLEKLGVEAPFGNAARDGDFSRLVEKPAGLFISQVKTFAFLEFTESGLEGGGAAAVEISLESMLMPADHVMRADRPFLIHIRDNKLKKTLLQAAVSKPNPS